MDKKNFLKYALRILVILFFISVSVFTFFYSSPEALIEFIGVENIYFLMFLLAFIGGATTFTGVPYHLILITFAVGGANPLFLGIVSTIGVMCGDSTSYFIGYQGEKVIPASISKFLVPVRRFGERHPKLLPLLFFLYGAVVPFSNDFIVISMALSRYPFWKVMAPLTAGCFVFNTTIAYLATYFFGILQGILF